MLMINAVSSSFKFGLFDAGGQGTLAPKASGLDS
jgi:acetate kinase